MNPILAHRRRLHPNLFLRPTARVCRSLRPGTVGLLLRWGPGVDNDRHYSNHGGGAGDPRLKDLGRQIQDEFAQIREKYDTPKNPVVLAHGLLGFAELNLAGGWLPAVQYWRGITDALTANGVEVITASVPPSGTIGQRAEKLGQDIAAQARGKSVNIIAHSMGGLDARCMISHLQPKEVDVASLVTVSTPHHGSSFADRLFDEIGPERLLSVYKFVKGVGMDTGAFSQLTQKYMTQEFNPTTPDDPNVRYFSYGAMMTDVPFLSPFKISHGILEELEGPNDGLVSVRSSRWGDYKGTLVGVSHIDLINWSNRLKWNLRKILVGKNPQYDIFSPGDR